MATVTLPSLVSLLFLLLIISSIPLPVSSARCDTNDKRALLRIKASFGNPYHLASWDPATGCCDWYGVDCNPATGRVTGLSIFQAGISGTIPSAVADLPLTSLILRKFTNLTGPIPPAIGRLTKLTFLSLDWNSLTGPVPDFLARLTALDYLNLSFNRLSGTIPAVLADLPLGFIRLDRNRLTGPIPDSLARSPATDLYLSHNNLTGPIPGSFASAGFQSIYVARNRLTGDARLLFGASKPLQALDLSRNLFEFDLTAVEFPENMTWLDLNHNMIRGSIPPQINKLELQLLNVSYNRLCGEIPSGGDLARFDQYSYFHNRCLCGPPLPACQ